MDHYNLILITMNHKDSELNTVNQWNPNSSTKRIMKIQVNIQSAELAEIQFWMILLL